MAPEIETQERPATRPPQEHRPSALSERDMKWRQFQSRNPRFRMFLIIGIVVLLVAGFFLWRYFGSYESTDDAQIDGHLNPVSARVSGHVEKLLVSDNQYVEAGAPLVQIDSRDYRVLVARAQADFDNAVAAAKGAGVNIPITSTSTSGQLASAAAEVASAQAMLAAAPQQVVAIRSRAQSAEALVEQKKAELDTAQLNLQYTTVISPVSGFVTNRTVEAGQNVQPGQELMRIINLDDIWVTANFKETQLRKMRVGQAVTVSVDTTGKDYKGHLQSIAGASGAITSLLPPENATGNYVKVVQRIPVKITFDSGETKEHVLRPGMSVEPKVWIR